MRTFGLGSINEAESGWIPTGFGRPKSITFLGSLCFHAVAISGLLYAHAHPGPPLKIPQKKDDTHPTVLKIGDKLYFVAQLPPPAEPKIEAPKAAPPKPKAPELKQIAKAPEPPPPPAEPAQLKDAPRVFVPPQVHKNLVSESTLIQPLTPPELVPENVPLPSFQIQTPQPKRLTRQLVTPGRPKAAPPAPTAQVLTPPTIDPVHADPTALDLKASLRLPPTPPPDAPPPPKPVPTNAPPPAPQGDPVNILSLSDRPVPPSDKLVVPPGNVIGRTGEGTVLTPAKPNAPTPVKPVTPDRPPAPPSTVASVSNLPPAPVPGNGTTPSTAPKSVPSTTTVAPAGNGTTAGGTAPTGNGNGRTQPGDTIHRPNNGSFDAVVVQSTPVDQFPESRDLLSGRPIYTVYVSVGSAKDWALYFCVPGEKPPAATPGAVVQLGAAKAVQAPYPTTLVRPNVSVPSFYKNVLIYGRVNAAGKFENLRVVRSVKPETDQALVTSLQGWQFRPASRDGASIGVEFLLAIPVAGL